MSTVLQVNSLDAGYGKRVVLHDVNFDIAAGEFVVLAGPNGAGKSTLLRTLTGLQPPLAGAITIDNKAIDALSARERARLFSLVTTERPAAGALTVRELVSLGRHPHTGWLGRLDSSDREIVERAIRDVGLSHKADAHISDMSDGECQKAMIARAVAQQTPVMLLDEPTSFLDVAARHEISGLLSEIARTGTAVIMSTHDISAAMTVATHVLTISPDGTAKKIAVTDPILEPAMTALFADRGLRYDSEVGDFRK